MCGICGVAAPNDTLTISQQLIISMRDTMTHRGPDDAGVFLGDSVGLGHRRLSIVDLGGGSQPMPNEDGTVWIAFNGEIYNHKEIRSRLEQLGHRYRSSCDTETILHLYEERGWEAVRELRGMFAFGIWDWPRRRLVLARDRLGIKPLYYVLTDDGVIYFASEIKALLRAGAASPQINFDSLSEYFANRYTSGEETLFRNVKRLLPGHTLVWSDGKVEIKRYWDVSFAKPESKLTEPEYVERFTELFEESVRLRLMADVPLGMFLSGGIDSSAIAAAMSGMAAEPIKTFSVAFREREANELQYARLVADQFGTEHHEVLVSPEQFFAVLPSLVYQEDEPIAHPSSVPLYFVSRLASQHVKVVLTGEGSDELLGGYEKYYKTIYNLGLGRAYHRAAPGLLRGAVKQTIENLDSRSWMGRKLSRTFLCLQPDVESIYFDNFSVFSRAMQQRLFTASARDRMPRSDPYRISLDHMRSSSGNELLDQLLAIDLRTYLHELLMKQDQMSMAASIESRVPFLDHKLVEFAAGLPTRMKLRRLKTKYILRRAMADRLPREILTRRKMGFPVPVGAWLRGRFRHVVDHYLLSSRARERGLFNHEYVLELVSRHNAGENHSERLWALINFEIWQRRFIDGEERTAVVQNPYRTMTAASVAL